WVIPGRLQFQQDDLAAWRSEGPLDLIFSNAALHWVDGHERLLPALVGMLAPGGTLAVQMPNNLRSPGHQAIAEIQNSERWRPTLGGVGLRAEVVQPLLWYAEQLHRLGLSVDAWETTYVHVLGGENPVLEWLKGTALRPLLARLPPAETEEFLAEAGARLRAAYRRVGDVTLLPYTRIFFVATKPA